jgi:hypothetical protein
MIDNTILKRREDEDFQSYHIRLFENKDEYKINNIEIAELLNKEYGSHYDESKWRKDFAHYVKWKDYLINRNLDKEIIDKYEEVRIESEKERIRKQDQRREYQKLIRNQSRFENLQSEIVAAIEELNQTKPLNFEPDIILGQEGKEGLALFSDWHYGSDVKNRFNTYDKHIFRLRLEKLVTKIINNGLNNNIQTLHVAQIGDIIAGQIHTANRVMSDENIIKQIQVVSEVLAEVLIKFAETFENVVYYNVIGNHSRTIANKTETGIKENFEYLIPWFLQTRLANIPNIKIVTDEDGVIETNILGHKIALVHGNYDSVNTVSERLSQSFGYLFQYIMMGHIHHHYEKEIGLHTQIIVNSSLIGSDDYAVQKRLISKPAQKFLIFNSDDGIECEYNIALNIM